MEVLFLSFGEGQSECQGKTICDTKRQNIFILYCLDPFLVILVHLSSHADLSFDELCWCDIRRMKGIDSFSQLSLHHSLSVHLFYLIFFYLSL